MALNDAQRANFQTLIDAAKADDLALMECVDIATRQPVAVLCAVSRDGGEYVMTPLARQLTGNPYEELAPPQ